MLGTNNCQYSTRYCWDAEKVKALIRLRAELSPLFTGKRNASKYAWAVVERELNVPLPLSKIIKKWNNLLQEYKAIKISEEPKRREWPFFTLMDVYFSDQVNDPSLRLFSSTKTLKESLDESVFEDDPIIVSAIAAVTSGACMEIEELLKVQKDRRANENKMATTTNKLNPDRKFLSENQFSCNKPINSKANNGNNANNANNANNNLRINGNKPKVVTVKNLSLMQQEDNDNNMKRLPEEDVNENREQIVSPKPLPRQENAPTISSVQNKFSDPNSIDQYLLSWNNFLGNMSRGFHSLQKDEKMVDVTIAAGGRIFKAHKLVLSVCSPYFQDIFLENPSNHPILLMADVEANHMSGLLNFMYSGQVNVKYEDLPAFLKVAETMKIKGLHTEKPEGRSLDEIQFSRDNCPSDMQAFNSTSMPVGFAEQSMAPPPFTRKDEQQCQSNFHPIDRIKNLDHLQFNSNAFSIHKTNSPKQLSDHMKQEKFFTKRKIFVHGENDFKEKKNIDVPDQDLYNPAHKNNLGHTNPQQGTLQGHTSANVNVNVNINANANTNANEEVLNLTQNGSPNVPKRFVPPMPKELKNDRPPNPNIFADIRGQNHKTTYSDSEMPFYPPSKSIEDGNNNIVNRKDDSFTEGENNEVACKNYANVLYNSPTNNERSENDDNNNGSTDSNYDVKIILKKQADNNNNVCITSSDMDDEKSTRKEDKNINPHPDFIKYS